MAPTWLSASLEMPRSHDLHMCPRKDETNLHKTSFGEEEKTALYFLHFLSKKRIPFIFFATPPISWQTITSPHSTQDIFNTNHMVPHFNYFPPHKWVHFQQNQNALCCCSLSSSPLLLCFTHSVVLSYPALLLSEPMAPANKSDDRL